MGGWGLYAEQVLRSLQIARSLASLNVHLSYNLVPIRHCNRRHGTCALSVMPSEHKYFKKVLKLNWRYSLEVRQALQYTVS